MGFFDLFKKKEPSVIKCVHCFREVGETNYWKIDGKQYCRDCYNKKITLRHQQGGNLSEYRDFEMSVEDVFFVKNRGVVLTGKISSGVVCVGDIVTVDSKEYKVIGIEMFRKLLDSAKEGDNIGLLIEAFNPKIFKKGDIVFAAKKTEKPQNTFVCKKCKRELNIKYLHNNNNTCAECFSANDNKSNSETVTNIAEPKHQELNLGCFKFDDAERQNIRAVAIRYMPTELGNIEAQLEIFKSLSAVMNIEVTELKTEFSWRMPENMPDELKEKRFKSALVETILSVNQSLSFLKPEFLIHKVGDASCDELLKAWIVLDYYANVLKPEYTTNIQHFRDYIHNTLLKYERDDGTIQPIKCKGTSILFDSKAFLEWRNCHPLAQQFEFTDSIVLTEKEPMILFFEDGAKTVEYYLQAEGDEDFTGKYFFISVRVGFTGNPLVPTMQMDGFISDTAEDRKMNLNDIGYRMEGHYLTCGGELSKQRYDAMHGQDLVMKGLKYQGYTTPSNIRLIGICPDCRKSFTFHAYSFYMAESDVAYSDDGLDVCQIVAHDIDKESWKYETEGKTFRYYNSFNCPHCGTPYIDYKKHPENKVFGVSGCVHLGRKCYRAE